MLPRISWLKERQKDGLKLSNGFRRFSSNSFQAFGTISIDRREAVVGGERVHLRPTEFKLLHQFINHPGSLMTHETLLSRVWGPEYRDDTQILRLYVTYLRKKLEVDPSSPRYIFNERGLGYRFRDYRSGES